MFCKPHVDSLRQSGPVRTQHEQGLPSRNQAKRGFDGSLRECGVSALCERKNTLQDFTQK